MDSDDRKLLEQTYAYAKENNKILRGIRSEHRWASIRRAIYWLVVIAAVVAGYVYLKPYLKGLQEAYKATQESIQEINEARNAFSNVFSPKQ